MAYAASGLRTVRGAGAVQSFVYDTTDALATVVGSGYISDGVTQGISIGDEVLVRIWATAVPALTVAGRNAATLSKMVHCYASAVSTNAVTVKVVDAE